MSFVLEKDAIETSPLRGVAKMIHILLAHHANKDGKCFPKQATLAAEAGCSDRYVRKILPKMAELGLIEIRQRSGIAGNYHEYVVIPSSASSGPEGTPSSGSSAHSSGSEGTSSSGSYKEEPSVEPSDEPSRNNCSTASSSDETSLSDEKEDAGMTDEEWDRIGVSDEQDERPARPVKPKHAPIPENSRKMCMHRFKIGAGKVGHPVYSQALLNKTISQFLVGEGKAVRPYSYAEIEKLFDVFFVRHGQDLRADTKDVVVAFMFFAGRVQKEAADSFAYQSPISSEENVARTTRWLMEAVANA